MASGVEVALGLVRDPSLGPLVMVAAGGVATDVWGDRAFLLPPLSHPDAARAIRSLRVWPLLDGFRGSPPVDVAALEELLVALGRLALDLTAVAELDLNPVLVGPEGLAVVDAKVRLGAPVGPDPSAPRQLRTLR
jgi:acyl-CoA synthetase (NDP forming)